MLKQSNTITPTNPAGVMRPADLRRTARNLLSRAEWLERRREPDPLIRAAARREAAHCRRLAALMLEGEK